MRTLRTWAWVALACVANVLVFFVLPAVPALRAEGATVAGFLFGDGTQTVTLGAGVDLGGGIATYDHVARLLAGEVHNLRTDLFFPYGYDKGAAEGYAWLDAALAWPLVVGLGVPDYYNLNLLLVLVGSQLALVWLYHRLGAPMAVAVGLGMLTLDTHYVWSEVYSGRPAQLHLIFPALFLVGVARLMAPGVRPLRHGILTGLCLAAAGFVYWFGAVAVGLLGAVALATHLILVPDERRARMWAGLVLTVVAVVPVLALTWRVAAAWTGVASGAGLGVLDLGFARIPIAAPDRYRLPSVWGLGGLLLTLGLPGLGFVLGGGALALAARRGRAAWSTVLPWAVGTGAVLTLPLGSTVRIGEVHVPTAFGLAHLVFPPMVRCNFPDRLITAPLLGLMALGAAGLALAPLRGRWAALGVGVLLGAFALHTDQKPRRLASRPLQDAPFYQQLDGLAPGAIIDVPLSASDEAYLYGLVHHRATLGGPGLGGPNTQPAEHAAWVATQPFLRALEGECEPGKGGRPWTEADRQALRDLGFGWVVVHRSTCRARVSDFDGMLGAPVVVGSDQMVYKL